MTNQKMHVVCSGCQAINGVHAGRLGQGPVCGKCGNALFPGVPVTLTDRTFERFVTKTSVPVLVDFWAPWCGPCKKMAPAFEQAAGRLQPRVILGKLDTQEHQVAAARFRIQSIPTLVLFQAGRELGRVSGAMQADQLVAWVEQVLG